jgi:hypothetical protein
MSHVHQIQPGMAGADFVKLTSEIKAWLLRHDVRFVLRYVVPPESTRIGKDLRDWEIEWYSEHGICVIPNWEIHHRDADGGAPRGLAAGRWLRTWAFAHEVPTDTHLVVSVDTNTHIGNLESHRAYVNAFKTAVAPYRFGVYGDTDIALAVDGELFWRANATAWGPVHPGAPVHIQQHRALYPPGVDPNTALLPFKAWLPGDHDPNWKEQGMAWHGRDGKTRIVNTITGLGAPKRKVAAGQVLEVGIPAAPDGKAANSAVLMVSIVQATEPGYVQVDGNRFGDNTDGSYRPDENNPTPTVAVVDDQGNVNVRLSHGEGHVVVDLLGIIT